MSRIIKGILPIIILVASSVAAAAQSGCPAIVTGAVLTAAQWNNCFILKQDALGYTPVNKIGDTMLGRLVTYGSTPAKAGFSVSPGTAPSSPLNGDVWIVSGGGMYYQSGSGATVGPLFGTNSAAALSAVNDTNVLATLSGTPASALLQPVTVTLGWTGTLSLARGGTGAGTQSGAANNIFPAPTRAGDIVYWNGSTWVTLPGNNAGTKILQETSVGVPSWVTAGTGTVTSVTCGTGLSGGTFTATGTCALALNNTSFNVATITGSGQSSASALMIGAGVTSCKLTPSYSGRVNVSFVVVSQNGGGSTFGAVYSLRYGTGTAPAVGAGATGTVAQGPFTASSGSGSTTQLTFSAVITGLTPGTAYWFDMAQTSNGSVTLTPTYGCSGFEF